MPYKVESLDNLNDPMIFIPGLKEIVHTKCSPWSSSESAPFLASTPSPGTGIIYSQNSCNICFAILMDTDLVMKIPVTVKSFKRVKIKAGTAVCHCLHLLQGHLKGCDYSI